MLTVLTGGTGGAKLVQGLALEASPEELAVVCNTADDFVLHGLHISPDLDTITYTLAGIGAPARGWGIEGDSFNALEQLGIYGGEGWFKLGDRDLAAHIMRTALLRQGLSLSEVTERIRRALGVKAAILPMSDDRVETRIVTPQGELSFQEYFVKRGFRDEVEKVFFSGIEKSRPAPQVIESIRRASAVIICPSNPATSIGPILALPGLRGALKESRAPVVAVSPIAGGRAFSGPAKGLMEAMGMEPSALGVVRAYGDFLDMVLIAEEDRRLKEEIGALGIRVVLTDIRMSSLTEKRRLAGEVLNLL